MLVRWCLNLFRQFYLLSLFHGNKNGISSELLYYRNLKHETDDRKGHSQQTDVIFRKWRSFSAVRGHSQQTEGISLRGHSQQVEVIPRSQTSCLERIFQVYLKTVEKRKGNNQMIKCRCLLGKRFFLCEIPDLKFLPKPRLESNGQDDYRPSQTINIPWNNMLHLISVSNGIYQSRDRTDLSL